MTQGTMKIIERSSDITSDELPQQLHPVLRRVLHNRGISQADQLELGLKAMESPQRLGGVAEAARLLANSMEAGEHIRVVGDFDADGATGTAIAIRAFALFDYHRVDFSVPNRFEFGYGLTPGLVETFSESPPDVILTVDSGISSLAGADKAKSLGCTVIITDHHLPGDTLPQADAIVNPNVPGDEFPSKSLAGVGVMFYLVIALRRELQQRGWFSEARPLPKLDSLLDLVALGTVADLVPLDHNNRILVHQGLQRIRAGRACPGIQALLQVGRREAQQVVASDLGFVVGPRLNAAGRLEDMTVGIRCLLTDDWDEAKHLAEWLDTLNRERQALQSEMEGQAQIIAQEQLESGLAALSVNSAGDNKHEEPSHADAETLWGLCLFQEDWHQGVVGLVASKVKDAVHRPVIAFAPESEGVDILKGSARSVRGVHIRDVLAHVDATEPGVMKAFGGHAMAAGLSLNREQFPRFQQLFNASLRQFMAQEHLQQYVEIDGELEAPDLTIDLALALREAAPWGQQFPEPLFRGRFDVVDQRIVGAAHLSMQLQAVNTNGMPVDSIRAIAFNTLPEDLPGDEIEVLYRLNVNYFRGVHCQLLVEHIL
jgi:single-stranded-DNA-specific exonuclease